MKTKFVDLTDEGTIIPIIILEFEESDNVFLKKSGWSTGLRIVLNFSSKRITCISGKSFRDRFGETIEELSQKMENNGTIHSFKESLNYIQDIRQLPDEFNVEAYRNHRNMVSNRRLIDREIIDIIDRYDSGYRFSYLRKHKYTKPYFNFIHMAIFDIRTKEILADIGRSPSCHLDIIAEYLWIPLPTANEDEIKCFESIDKEQIV